MKNIILYLVIIFISIAANAQHKSDRIVVGPPTSKPLSKRVIAIEKKNHRCVNKTNKSLSHRLKNFPFNQSSQVKLASFKGFNLPKLNDSIFYSKLFEVKTLTPRQIDSLTNILYNIGFGGTTLFEEELNCYDPRNAILFVDSSGKTFAYIEICFECQQTVTSSENISLGDICDQKYAMIKRQFKRAGIHYGISDVH